MFGFNGFLWNGISHILPSRTEVFVRGGGGQVAVSFVTISDYKLPDVANTLHVALGWHVTAAGGRLGSSGS